jgi:hypothetical protein
VITTIVTKYVKVVITGSDNNISPNKCRVINKGTRKTTTNFEYNRKSAINSI